VNSVEYKIKAVDLTSLQSIFSDVVSMAWDTLEKKIAQTKVPKEFLVQGNYPNPFNPSTKISFGLAASSRVSLRIYNPLGQEIATLLDEDKEPGYYTIDWNAGITPSGIYFYRISAGKFSGTGKMILMK
jgi:hypothetical protein